MIPGKEVTIGGKKYTFPPINIAMRRQHAAFLGKSQLFADGSIVPGNDDVLQMVEVVKGAFKRNYPDEDFVLIEEMLDDEKLMECYLAILSAGKAGPALGEPRPGSP